MLTFLSPLFLIGLVSAAIPLLIHLSRSRRTKKIRFSTTRFFTDQFLRSYRMSRLKELLLLACRMALCALLAVALASPILMPRSGSPLVGESRAVMIVIDNSASMSAEHDGQSMFERACTAARELLDGLRPGDTAGLVLAGRRATGPETPFTELTPNLGDVRQAIDGLQVSALGTDLSGAVERARSIVNASDAESKEVYVLSDLQDSGWQLPDGDSAWEQDAEAMVFFVRVRPPETAGLAVTAVQYAAARPMVGVPFSIRPHIRNQGNRARACQARLYIDGQLVGERKIEQLQGGRWSVPRFHHTFDKGGWHEGYVEISDASIPADNRRWFAFEVVESVRVLAVNGAPSRVPRLDELFFLKAALAAPPEAESPIHLDVASPDGLSGADLSGYRAVILANVDSLPSGGMERLEAFVDRGGSLLVFLGDRTNQAFFNQAFAAPTRLHGGLAPGKLIGREGNPADERDMATIGAVDFDHAALAAFHDPQFANLGLVRFRALWTIDPGESPVLMRADTGSPLLVEKAFGKGHVMLFASTCDRDWTDFPVRPAFLPWVYRLIGYLAQEPLGRQGFHHTGDVLPVPISASEGVSQVLVRSPDKSVRPATAGVDPGAPLVFADTNHPGVYTLFARGQENQAQRFVVNLESFESDLTWLDEVFDQGERGDSAPHTQIEAGFQELLGGSAIGGLVAYVDDPARLGEASLAARRGLKLWDFVLVVALCVGLFEPWLANRISLRHYARPREIAATGPRSGAMHAGQGRPVQDGRQGATDLEPAHS